jgi:nucleoside-diphosphate-sugar epimerase
VDFDLYSSCNLLATQRLIDAFRGSESLKKFVYASTSSVYGKFSSGDEQVSTRPVSPYGVTKLAGEMLCHAFREEFHLPAVVLRYFSVYGPGQRPDMGYHKFVKAMLEGTPITVYGDGHQSRGNTFVADCVDATIAAVKAPVGETYNIGGGETASVWDILGKLERITGMKARVRQEEARAGDQRTSQADISKATRDLGWSPKVSLDDGLARQVAWQRGHAVRKAA